MPDTDPAAMLALIGEMTTRGYRVVMQSDPIGPGARAVYACFVWQPGEGEPVGDEEGDSLPLVVARAALAALRTADA